MINIQSTWVRALLLILLLAGTSVIASAAVPDPPDSLKSWVDNSSGNTVVTLWWETVHPVAGNRGYKIYQASGTTSQLSDFTLIHTIGDTSASITTYQVAGLTNGVYSFYVTATNSDGESRPSPIEYVTVSEYIGFTTTPLDTGRINVPYAYNASAWSSLGGTVTYTLVTGQPGMTLNSSTGALNWTPISGGDYYVWIRASVAAHPEVTVDQGWVLHVFSCSTPAIVAGRVTIDDNRPVTQGRVSLWRHIATPVGDSSKFVTESSLDTSGNYIFSIDAESGDYQVRAEGDLFDLTWYSTATSNPASVSIGCGATVTADIGVTRTRYMATGRVVQRSDGGYRPGVPIKFYRVGTDTYYETIAADSGLFAISLPKNQNYIAYADAEAQRGSGLKSQYYDAADYISDATQISMNSDRSGINFALDSRPVYGNSISGLVRDSAGRLVSARLRIYQVEQIGGTLRYQLARTVITDSSNGTSNASFKVDDLLPGSYLIHAEFWGGRDSSYAPGYYVSGNYAVTSWEDATRIDVGSSSNVSDVIVKLPYANGAHGQALLRGTITQSGGSARKWRGASPQSATPASGVVVVAIDASNRISSFDVTDANGQFTLAGLARGTYTIVADRMGLRTYRGTETFAVDGEEHQVEQTMESAGTSSVTAPVAPVSHEASIYPNPAADRVTVQFRTRAGLFHVTMADALGRQVYTTSVQTVGGLAEFYLDASVLPSGIYMVRITGDSISTLLPLHIVR